MTLYLHTAPAGEAIDYTKSGEVKKPLPGALFVSPREYRYGVSGYVSKIHVVSTFQAACLSHLRATYKLRTRLPTALIAVQPTEEY